MKSMIAVLLVVAVAMCAAGPVAYNDFGDDSGLGFGGYQQQSPYGYGSNGGARSPYRLGQARFTNDNWDSNHFSRDWGKKGRLQGILLPNNDEY